MIKNKITEAFTWNVKYFTAILFIDFPEENSKIPTKEIKFNSIINQVNTRDELDRDSTTLNKFKMSDIESRCHEIYLSRMPDKRVIMIR